MLLKYYHSAWNLIDYLELRAPGLSGLDALQINTHRPEQAPFDLQLLLPEAYVYRWVYLSSPNASCLQQSIHLKPVQHLSDGIAAQQSAPPISKSSLCQFPYRYSLRELIQFLQPSTYSSFFFSIKSYKPKISDLQPIPFNADMLNAFPLHLIFLRKSLIVLSLSLSSIKSILLIATYLGFL